MTATGNLCDKPLAARGLRSYRYAGAYGWVMIGALGDADALKEAARSVRGGAVAYDNLQRWDGTKYVPAASS